MKNRKMLKNEKGFTLIEIIAVIIIMGILAAVAVPKFFSMQEDAKQASVDGALSEAAARFNQAYARYILDKKEAPASITDLSLDAYLGATAGTSVGIGDFTVKWTANTTDTKKVDITVLSSTSFAITGLTVVKTIGDISWKI